MSYNEKENKKEYYLKNKDKILKQRKIYAEKNKKKISERQKKKYKEDLKDPEFRKKRKEYDNKPEVKERKKAYIKEYANQLENKEKRRKYLKEYRKDSMVRISHNFSTNIRNSLKSNKLSKNKKRWEDIIGYTLQELIDHLESLFTKRMNWDNYGDWVIDHIIPQTFFKYNSTNDVEFLYCWSLNNLQPLWEKDNNSKKDKIILWGKEVNARNIF